eukprot:UN23334
MLNLYCTINDPEKATQVNQEPCHSKIYKHMQNANTPLDNESFYIYSQLIRRAVVYIVQKRLNYITL